MESYRLSPKAEDDLYHIWLFGLEQFGVAQADRYYLGLIAHFSKLTQAPLQYPSVDHIQQGYRRSIFGSHSIYYRIQPHFIEIMRIIGHEAF